MTWRSLIWLGTAPGLIAACDSGPKGFDLSDCSLSVDEFFDGGVARDGIPALTDPDVRPALLGEFLMDEDRVLGMVVDGEARAYPMAVLWWHEVVNDTLGGEAVLVTYCPLTGSGIAFDPRVGGEVKSFGVSGLLRENNLVMFDRESESLWNQMLLGAQCGLERGETMQRMPIVETTWGHWKAMYPNTTVMTTNTGFDDRPYGVYPYGTYDEPNNPFTSFPSAPFSDLRPPKELVLGVFEGSEAVAYAFGILLGMGRVVAVNDRVGGRPILITYVASDETAMAFDRRVTGQELTFAVADEDALTFVDTETGTTWDATGLGISGPLAGEQMNRIQDSYTVFWFAWSVYYPDTRLFI